MTCRSEKMAMHPSYKKQLLLLPIELVKLQRHFIQCNNKIVEDQSD